MSWTQDIGNSYRIKTGDSKEFTVDGWLNAQKTQEFNLSTFEFPSIEGTKVDRKLVKGRKFTLEIYFTGEDNILKSDEFETSAKDSRYWTIEHPFYKTLYVQPTTLTYNDNDYNVTKITGTLLETITDTTPRAQVIKADKVDEDVEITNNSQAVYLENNNEIKQSDINDLKKTNFDFYSLNVSNILEKSQAQQYFNLFNIANNALDSAISEVSLAVRATQEFILAPARFEQSLESKLILLQSNFDSLNSNLHPIPTKQEKQNYEMQGMSVINAFCLASVNVNEETDFDTRKSVSRTIDQIQLNYNIFLLHMDNNLSGTGGNPNDFIPNAQSMIQLNNLVNYTLGNLHEISFNAKQERIITLQYDSDYINLTHRVYGIDFLDENIDRLIKENNFGINGALTIKKGTEVKYYI